MSDTRTMYAVLNTDTHTFIKRGSFGGHLYDEKSNAEDNSTESHLEVIEMDIPIEHAPFI